MEKLKHHAKGHDWELHDVIIKKTMPLMKAENIAHKFIGGHKHYYRETEHSYRFRNEPKEEFSLFKSKVINPEITLVEGRLK